MMSGRKRMPTLTGLAPPPPTSEALAGAAVMKLPPLEERIASFVEQPPGIASKETLEGLLVLDFGELEQHTVAKGRRVLPDDAPGKKMEAAVGMPNKNVLELKRVLIGASILSKSQFDLDRFANGIFAVGEPTRERDGRSYYRIVEDYDGNQFRVYLNPAAKPKMDENKRVLLHTTAGAVYIFPMEF